MLFETFEYHELSVYTNIHLSISNIESFLHWLNHSIKVSVSVIWKCMFEIWGIPSP